MSNPAPSAPAEQPKDTVRESSIFRDGDVIAGRYRVLRTLGRGGMGVVLAAHDSVTGREIAVKRLRDVADSSEQRELLLFEREFLTLAHVAHPAVVSVYDYGVDEAGPYYTMELLDGGDLQALAPLPYRTACALMRDVLGALSLLHSRRMVYRDLSPRNVRCASDGSAKLIDFGAMSPMGPSREWVGTLPFCAPEALYSQPLDARTDLYAFGATLYYALVKRHAYPARDAAQLHELWESSPPRPSELRPDIPEALDALVMELIHPEAALRPASAAEVMQRLTAIADLAADEQPSTSQAYLSTPALTGRDAAVALIQKLVTRAAKGRGASVLIQGGAGAGRSRLLESCVLHAKVAGTLVLQADARDEGRYGAVRALGRQLLAALPDVAPAAAAEHAVDLQHVLPELAPAVSEAAGAGDRSPDSLDRRTQAAFRRWFLEISRKKPVLIAIDDLHLLDEESVAVFALLGGEISQHAVLVATTLDASVTLPHGMRSRCRLLQRTSLDMVAHPLSEAQTQELLGSVFGDVPNLQIVSRAVQALAGGNPRDILQLAQHLVDEGLARYREGEWSLPSQLSDQVLPASMADAVRARCSALGADALHIARSMALEPRLRFDFAECAVLCGGHDVARVLTALEELNAAGVVILAGERYAIAGRSVEDALLDGTRPSDVVSAHRALAGVCERRGDAFRVAQHLLLAGDEERALDILVEHALASERLHDTDAAAYLKLMVAPPHDWLQTYDLALRVAERRGRPARDLHQIRLRISVLVSISLARPEATQHVEVLIERLYHDSGLDIHARLDEALDPGARLALMFQEASARYAATPERDRVLDPGSAIRQLARVMLEALGLIALSNDDAFWRRLPSLAPLTPLSPALGVVDCLVKGLGARMAGRTEQALESYAVLLRRLAEPDGAGFGASHVAHTRLRVTGSVGIQEAALGLRACLERAAEIEPHPLHELNAKQLRMLHHLWQGDLPEAHRLRREVELLRIQSSERQAFDSQHLMVEVVAHALSENLTQMKRAVDAVAPFASVYPGWAAVLHYARGEYQRVRGDHAAALEELDRALASMQPGRHQLWAQATGARVRTLLALGRPEDGRACAEAALTAAEQSQLGYVQNYVRMPLALALAALGRHAEAADSAQRAIASFEALGSTGLNLALAYETRARVAELAGDGPGVVRFSTLAAAQIPSGGKSRFLNVERRFARAAGKGGADVVGDTMSQASQLSSMLQACGSGAERALCGLEALVRQSGAASGVLYVHDEEGLVCAARAGDFTPDAKLESLLHVYFEKEASDREETQSSPDPAAAARTACEWTGPQGRRCVPVLLSHADELGWALTGLAVLVMDASVRFTYPSRGASELSRGLAKAGDARVVHG
jgi:tetratricopeptide (TPR) repeat protein